MIENKSIFLKNLISENNNVSENSYVYPEIKKAHVLNNAGKKALKEKDTVIAYDYFKAAGNINACAYCKILEEDLKSAEIMLNLVKDSSPFGNWLIFLIALIEDKYEPTTYFRIRNFYEQDLEMLFYFERKKYIKKIIDKNPYIEKFNREIYKYTARVLLNNEIYDIAEKMLLKSCEICYNDPETHYMKGEIELRNGNTEAAVKEFQISADITGNYKPALEKLKMLTK